MDETTSLLLVAPSKTRRFLDICTEGSDFHYDPLRIVLELNMAPIDTLRSSMV